MDATVDPLGGSWFVEALTDETETAVLRYLDEIDRRGGMVAAITEGYPQREIADAAYRYQREFDAGERRVVGINAYADEIGASRDPGPRGAARLARAPPRPARADAPGPRRVGRGIGVARPARRGVASGVERDEPDAAFHPLRRRVRHARRAVPRPARGLRRVPRARRGLSSQRSARGRRCRPAPRPTSQPARSPIAGPQRGEDQGAEATEQEDRLRSRPGAPGGSEDLATDQRALLGIGRPPAAHAARVDRERSDDRDERAEEARTEAREPGADGSGGRSSRARGRSSRRTRRSCRSPARDRGCWPRPWPRRSPAEASDTPGVIPGARPASEGQDAGRERRPAPAEQQPDPPPAPLDPDRPTQPRRVEARDRCRRRSDRRCGGSAGRGTPRRSASSRRGRGPCACSW